MPSLHFAVAPTGAETGTVVDAVTTRTDVVTGATDVVGGATDAVTGATVTVTGATDVVSGVTDMMTGARDVVGGATNTEELDFGALATTTAFQTSFFPTFLQTRGFLAVPVVIPALRQVPLTLAAETCELIGANNETTKVTPITMGRGFFIRLNITELRPHNSGSDELPFALAHPHHH